MVQYSGRIPEDLIKFALPSLYHISFLLKRAYREEYQGVLKYTVPDENIVWSSLFGIMEKAKKKLKIEDYAISQNSLEQVVLMFVKDQTDQRYSTFRRTRRYTIFRR